MKMTLAILIAGLFLMLTPLSALAQGSNYHGKGAIQSHGWSNDRQREHRDDHVQHNGTHRDHLARNHFDRHQQRHQVIIRPAPRYERHVYASAPIIVTPSRIVFRIGW